jgi:hypothetical protein
MKTSLWGPSAWQFLHAATFAYPEEPTKEHKEAARNLFKSLKLMLPCGDCCTHYCSGFDGDPVDNHLHSRDALSRWLVAFHNKVNVRLGKPEVSFDMVQAQFDTGDETCSVQSSCADVAKPPSRDGVSFKLVFFMIAVFVVALVLRRFV